LGLQLFLRVYATLALTDPAVSAHSVLIITTALVEYLSSDVSPMLFRQSKAQMQQRATAIADMKEFKTQHAGHAWLERGAGLVF
jgi:hypothetical protein